MKVLKNKKTNVAERKFSLQLTMRMDFPATKLFPKQEEIQETRKLAQIRACVRSYLYPFLKPKKTILFDAETPLKYPLRSTP